MELGDYTRISVKAEKSQEILCAPIFPNMSYDELLQNSVAFSPQANYTDQVTAAFRRS
jgi:hypothetical protein